MHATSNKKLKLIIKLAALVILIATVIISSTSCVDADAFTASAFDSIYPNVNLFIVHIAASVTIIILAIWLVWRPTKQMIEARRELAIKNVTDADNAKKKAYERLVEAERKRLEAYDEAQQIIEKANRDSLLEYDRIIADAKKTANDIVEKAHGNVRSLHRSLEMEANKRIVELTFLTSEEILHREIDKKTNQKIINEFIDNIDKISVGGRKHD
ncbi:MAG: hypothetical protein LBV22_03850 [Mycoplasmataceae bacterium]|jgi:F-type H+-transporting ATPase subunit b|nr:hypothetical protein [Mycoplasmataceae bacterium]